MVITGAWRCDCCGQQITRAEDGMVQWLRRYEDGKPVGRDLRLVHALHASPRHKTAVGGGCYFDEEEEFQRDGSVVEDVHLTELLGADGLVRLLELTATGEFTPQVAHPLIQRLHVPNYEQALARTKRAMGSGALEPGGPEGYLSQRDIRLILDPWRAP